MWPVSNPATFQNLNMEIIDYSDTFNSTDYEADIFWVTFADGLYEWSCFLYRWEFVDRLYQLGHIPGYNEKDNQVDVEFRHEDYSIDFSDWWMEYRFDVDEQLIMQVFTDLLHTKELRLTHLAKAA